MTQLLSDISTVITAILTQITAIANSIVSTPLLLLGVAFFFTGGVIGILGRMLSRN